MKRIFFFLIFFFLISPAFAKTFAEKELERREKLLENAQQRREKILERYESNDLDNNAQGLLKDNLTELGKIELDDKQESREDEKDSSESEQDKSKERSWLGIKKKSPENQEAPQESNEKQKEEVDEKKSELEILREEIKANETQALNFIFQSEDLENDSTSSEKFFSKSEKEQLLELWRSTLARNRTIQFVIQSLSTDPNDYKKNNAVMQVLSRALFVPFYAVSAVADNALMQGGTAVGARVLGDVVDAKMQKSDRTKQVTRTDLIVLFMLVDEVAERLRNTYSNYREVKIAKEMLEYEIKLAQLDHKKALNAQKPDQSLQLFTELVIRDIERKLRQNKLNFSNYQRKLIELAGEEAVNNVDLLIDLEIDESLRDILGV